MVPGHRVGRRPPCPLRDRPRPGPVPTRPAPLHDCRLRRPAAARPHPLTPPPNPPAPPACAPVPSTPEAANSDWMPAPTPTAPARRLTVRPTQARTEKVSRANERPSRRCPDQQTLALRRTLSVRCAAHSSMRSQPAVRQGITADPNTDAHCAPLTSGNALSGGLPNMLSGSPAEHRTGRTLTPDGVRRPYGWWPSPGIFTMIGAVR